ncbi:LuxR C-terminal-related transcriptional regulator [Nonomuraea sp. NPDC046570]|uniref:ATP-binding protein n=1 Tax=Nonomuraea sp. NPDC046570 TaxID=3155255 RepID=UPI0034062898
MGADALRAAGVTARELEVFWLVGDRLQNREIADSLRLSERTVESHVSSLLRKLGGSNRLALVDAATRLRARRDPGSVLPRPLSSFVGRTREIEDLHRLVGVHRLLTLTGPAGTGKTRLALHLAHSVTSLPPAVLVDLAAVPFADLVERAFGVALGVSGDGRRLRGLIRGSLAEGKHWLVVDNCEHVTAGAAELLADLLATTEHLHVLATSHGPLGVAGEVVYEIPPLPLPEELDDPPAVLGAAAGRLFADRAAAVSTGFEITAANARDVATICRRLDGLPLAIELAAARIRFFSPAELLARLDNRFALLTGGVQGAPNRHRTLEEALRWSYELLSDEERLLFERCSVFPGEFDYDTAVQVLAYPPLDSADLVRLFPRLLDRSLVSRRLRDQTTEYRLLDSVRQFAARQLAARGAAGTAHEQHARHHLGYALAALPDLRGRDQAGALHWFDRHCADLRIAMHWALDRADPTPAWEFVAGVGSAWEILGSRGELYDWLERLLERPLPQGSLRAKAAVACSILLAYQDTARAQAFAEQTHVDHGSDTDKALLHLALGWAMMYGEHRPAAIGHLEEAATRFERLGDDWHRALALSGLASAGSDTDTAVTRLAHAADLFGRLHDQVKRANCFNAMASRAIEARTRLDEAALWLAEAARLARASGNHHERLHAEVHRAALDQQLGDHTTAEARFVGLLVEFRRIGDHRCTARCLIGLGRAATYGGDHFRAVLRLTEGTDLAVAVGDLRATLTGLHLLAGANLAAGRAERAAALLGAAERLDPEHREGLVPDADLGAALRERLGPETFAAALATGTETPLSELLSS